MSFISSGMSAIGRLAALAGLAAAFLFGMAGVVYMSLQGSEVKVPEILGKDLPEGERELASIGLKLKKRAERVSEEQPGTVIEQLPKPGETVKTGQMILVVTSKGPGQNGERPALKTGEEDDTEKIEEMISDEKPKKRSNGNVNRKKADTTRDVNAAGNSNNASTGPSSNSNKKDPAAGSNSTDKPNKNTQSAPPTTKPGGDRPRPEKRP